MTLDDFIRLADEYTSLGGSVQEQLKACIENSDEETLGEQNSNALLYAADFLSSAASYLEDDDADMTADEIRTYLTNLESAA